METVNVPVSTLETLIEGLESAIKVSYAALDNPDEQGYPYATGYSRQKKRNQAFRFYKMLIRVLTPSCLSFRLGK